jgi:hypothetical protein
VYVYCILRNKRIFFSRLRYLVVVSVNWGMSVSNWCWSVGLNDWDGVGNDWGGLVDDCVETVVVIGCVVDCAD